METVRAAPAAPATPAPAAVPAKQDDIPGRILVVDDEPALLRAYSRTLSASGHQVETASDGEAAVGLCRANDYDVIISDISMPGMDGIQLLRTVRESNLDVPVVLVTASPAVQTALEAVEYGALRYLLKPVDIPELRKVVSRAVYLHRLAKVKREALDHLGASAMQLGDRASLEAAFARALRSLWMAFQPIVDWPRRRIYAYEALVRTTEPAIPHPGALFDAAERLGRLVDLSRAIRGATAAAAVSAPPDATLFVNLHTHDLLDEDLYQTDAPLTAMAGRIVLEITERASLEDVKDLRTRVARLRERGFRIAIDDLGAGYAGLTAFAQLEPEIVKLDMSIVREVHVSPTKQKLVRSMTNLCHDLGMRVVAEGVETIEERDMLDSLSCDYLQGFFFARPVKGFTEVAF
ncbi:MAG: EAL domain-containing protein [Deltaproteobacteria bacterium]|nr:EAL domain-containing protein [Deltaproteobacteria bacterium]